ncbi:hypothetical protein [Sphingobacterium sp. SYP-B4668]|uniref:hypothetical protein n=1 Tax=Sphingobacterium sp. SYP-B4668 TaxID=2996035 RepID=UPI0022DDFFCD|nr:hypothetical protein [Sphingobacterium sp. SYP-B4668]
MYKIYFILAILVTGNLSCIGQEIVRNLGFEQLDPNGRLIGWEFGNTKQKYQMKLDTAISHTGRCSFSIEMPSDTVLDRGIAGASSIFIASSLKSKKNIKIAAYIKTENLVDGVAAVGMRLNGENGPIHELNSNDQSPKGTSDWKMVEIELPLTAQVQSVSFAFHMDGKGKAWFDDFQIFIDGTLVGSKLKITP